MSRFWLYCSSNTSTNAPTDVIVAGQRTHPPFQPKTGPSAIQTTSSMAASTSDHGEPTAPGVRAARRTRTLNTNRRYPCQGPTNVPAEMILAMRALSEYVSYDAPSTAAIARRVGLAPEQILRFDGNTAPRPPAYARAQLLEEELARVHTYPHGG